MYVVGDGDSSLMSSIRESVPYGMFVQKIECANHACKAYRSRLEELAKAIHNSEEKEVLTIQRKRRSYKKGNPKTCSRS